MKEILLDKISTTVDGEQYREQRYITEDSNDIVNTIECIITNVEDGIFESCDEAVSLYVGEEFLANGHITVNPYKKFFTLNNYKYFYKEIELISIDSDDTKIILK